MFKLNFSEYGAISIGYRELLPVILSGVILSGFLLFVLSNLIQKAKYKT